MSIKLGTFEFQTPTIRVFVSSTFKDMQEEREELVKFTFPELRKLCDERGVVWGEVDLRWGVPDEQKAEGKVLPVCLEEIKNCRPYFICLLGERYGWIPDMIPPELIEREPWLAEHLDHSVTELEILHGVLRNPDMAEHAIFYFRDPEYLKRLPAGADPNDFLSEDDRLAAKLLDLKNRIRKSGFPVREDYPDPKALSESVLDDFTNIIDRLFPPESIPDPLDKEAWEHEAFADSRRRIYIEREDYFERLDAHALSDDQPLIISGESGSGKSALLANWAFNYRQQHPDYLLLMHFIGSSPYSTDWRGMLRRIMGEFKRHFGIEQEIPDKPEELRSAFVNWLHTASTKGRTVLILDGLNQLEDRDLAPDLVWLPPFIPTNIRLILSTLPGRSLDELNKRDWSKLQVEPLKVEERLNLIERYLSQYTKRLSAKHSQRIAEAPQSSNPLYLRVLLEELRIFGVHEQLEQKIEHYLSAPDVTELYKKVLNRYEQDYERDRPGLVRDSMSLIWASRRGLTETELLDMLGTEEQPLPPAVWSPLYLAARDSLVTRSGMLNFFHDYLRDAVRENYLPTEERQKTTHLRIADYFEKHELGIRKVDELPWHYQQAQDGEKLKDCISDMDMFRKLNTEEKQYELGGYWLNLGNRYDMAAVYNEMIKQYEKTAPDTTELSYRLHQVAYFLNLNAKYEEAEPLCQRALKIREKALGLDHPAVANSLNNLASLYYDQGLYEQAEPLFQQALKIREKVLGPDHPDTATSLTNLANLNSLKGRYEQAEPLYHRALKIREKALGPNHHDTANSLKNLAELYNEQGYYEKAEKLYQQALKIEEKALGPEHPEKADSLNRLAEIYRLQGNYKKTKPLYLEALRIREKVLGPSHPDTAKSLNDLAQLYKVQGYYKQAEPLYLQALEIREKVLGLDHRDTATSLHNLAELYSFQRQFKEAELLYKQALRVYELALGPDHKDTATTLHCLANLYCYQGLYEQAEPLYQRALKIYEKALGSEHPFTAASLIGLAEIYRAQGHYDQAEPLYQRALKIYEKALGPDHPHTATSLNNLAALYYNQGRYEQAETFFKQALKICEKAFGSEHPETCNIKNNLEYIKKQK